MKESYIDYIRRAIIEAIRETEDEDLLIDTYTSLMSAVNPSETDSKAV